MRATITHVDWDTKGTKTSRRTQSSVSYVSALVS